MPAEQSGICHNNTAGAALAVIVGLYGPNKIALRLKSGPRPQFDTHGTCREFAFS